MATTITSSESPPLPKSAVRAWLASFDGWLERTGDRLNPILVKECRQALKGRQFSITFALVLLCCWIWSIWGVMLIGPGAGFGAAAEGMSMFNGYFVILAFPLLVIVPYGAFRSLLDEREDRTFDLLAITTLSPRQIVGGKLGSAAVQLLVYMSAVSPCLAFTYLLRGIEAPTIFITLTYMALASLGLSLLAILAGTLASERPWQAIWSVFIIVGLLGTFYWALRFALEVLLPQRLGFDSEQFWFTNALLLIVYASYFALCFLAAAARLTFVSENRSTALRVVMFVQPILLLFCIVWGTVRFAEPHLDRSMISEELVRSSMVYFFMLAVHWYVMGVMMTGELPRLSNRAKRRLPQSFLGRAFLTWFNPGPGTGYLFAVSNLLGALVLVFMAVAYHAFVPRPARVFFGGPTPTDMAGLCRACVRLRGAVFGLGQTADRISAAIRAGGDRAGRVAASAVGAGGMPCAANHRSGPAAASAHVHAALRFRSVFDDFERRIAPPGHDAGRAVDRAARGAGDVSGKRAGRGAGDSAGARGEAATGGRGRCGAKRAAAPGAAQPVGLSARPKSPGKAGDAVCQWKTLRRPSLGLA